MGKSSFKLPRAHLVTSSDREASNKYKLQNSDNINGVRRNSNIDLNENSISYSVQNGDKTPHVEEEEDTVPISPEEEVRGTWGRKMEFLMSCIAMSVGLGNVWRFPNIAFENGGGAFVLLYLILLFIIGRPLYYLELILGQFSGCGPIKVWNCVPALRGIGYAQMVSTFYIMVFYNFLSAITLFYLFASMQSKLPWTECSSEWAECNDTSHNLTLTEQYLNNYVLHKSSGLEDVNSIDYRLILCLLLAWIVVFLSIIRGVESAGKVAYFTALFPYTILIALLIVAFLEEGALDGVKYFFEPKWEKLKDPKVWYEACQQSFFSLAVGFGALIMYSSYNDFRHNIYRDAIIISVTDTITSVLAGSVIFSVLGTLSHSTGQPIEKVIKEAGMGLAFVAYPEALGRIKVVPQLWAVLFFFMIFTLAVGSSVAQVETILTPLRDKFPKLRKQKWKLAAVACSVAFLCGLPLTTDAGLYIMTLIDNYGVGTAAFLYGIVEVIGIMWIYGFRNFLKDVAFMQGSKPGIYWVVTWVIITPVALIVIFIYGNIIIAQGERAKGIPDWGNALGWIFASFAIAQIPIWAVWTYVNNKILERKTGIVVPTFTPTAKWGPRSPKYHLEWRRFRRGEAPPMAMEPPPPYDNYAFEDHVTDQSPSTSWENIASRK